MNNVVSGTALNFTIDYSLALLCRGTLSGVLNETTDLSTAGEVTINWDDNLTEGNANADDKAMILVYNPEKKESIYTLDGANRTTGTDVISIPSSYAEDTVHLFMAFVTSNNSSVSNSIYLGSGTAI